MKISTKIQLLLASGIIMLAISSCFKSDEYPIEPIISDPQVSFNSDSAIVTFTFTDGDADLGLNPADTFGVHAPGEYFYYNIYLEYFEKDDNLGWVPGLDLMGDTIVFAYRIKPIEVSENTEGIKGTMDITVESYYNPFSTQSDTIKFRITLIDRALNQSDPLETSEIVVP